MSIKDISIPSSLDMRYAFDKQYNIFRNDMIHHDMVDEDKGILINVENQINPMMFLVQNFLEECCNEKVEELWPTLNIL